MKTREWRAIYQTGWRRSHQRQRRHVSTIPQHRQWHSKPWDGQPPREIHQLLLIPRTSFVVRKRIFLRILRWNNFRWCSIYLPVLNRTHLMGPSFNLCIKCNSVFCTRYRVMETILGLWLLYRDLMEVTTPVCCEFIREKKLSGCNQLTRMNT